MTECVLIKGFKWSLSLSFCLFDVRVRSLLSQYISLATRPGWITANKTTVSPGQDVQGLKSDNNI